MRITLSGNLGSGKSTVGRKLGIVLGIPYMSTGQMFREIGRIRNLDALKTNLAAENNVDIDFQVDERTRKIDGTVADFIMDSRMAWHFVGNAVRVFLSASRETAAARIIADDTRATEKYASLAEAISSLDSRRASETLRYKRLYGVDIESEDNYDLHIITDDADPDDIVRLIATYLESRFGQKYWIPKTRIVPLISVPGAVAPRRSSGESGTPELCIEDNFGFYAGDADALMTCLRGAGALAPYAKANCDETAQAIKAVPLADLRRWEDAAGVKLSFATRLASLLVSPPAGA